MSDAFKTLQEAASELGVTHDTLKRWTREFSPFLSASRGAGKDGARRRFVPDDMTVLRRIKEQLTAGQSTEEVAEYLQSEGRNETSELVVRPQEGALATEGAALGVLTDTLRAMIENQQTIQNSLQVNRNLQGVIIQDNFNLKEENIKLRERMQKLEQELSELRKRDLDHRLLLEQRLAHLEQESRKSFWSKLF